MSSRGRSQSEPIVRADDRRQAASGREPISTWPGPPTTIQQHHRLLDGCNLTFLHADERVGFVVRRTIRTDHGIGALNGRRDDIDVAEIVLLGGHS